MKKDSYYWRDRVVVITGAASGIGLALANALIQRGSVVWLADISNKVQDIAQELGQKARSHVFDVASFEQWQEFIERVIARDSQIHFAFNNAGVGYGCDSLTLTNKHYDRYIDINIRGVTNSLSIIYPMMVEQGEGTIVNTASVGGLIPSALITPYSMTKNNSSSNKEAF